MPDFTISVDSAALFVAGCALVATLVNDRANRVHNRLSVRPKLSVTTETRHLTVDGKLTLHVSAVLRNTGLGPAIIQHYLLLRDREPEKVESVKGLRDFLERLPLGTAIGNDIHFTHLRPKHVLASDERVTIGSFSLPDPPLDIETTIERIGLLVEYSSLYGDVDVYDSRMHLDEAPSSPWYRKGALRQRKDVPKLYPCPKNKAPGSLEIQALTGVDKNGGG